MAQKMARRNRAVVFPASEAVTNPVQVEPGLPAALAGLSARQREIVVLVSAYGLSQRDTAQMLGVSRSSVQRHLERGLARLRRELGVGVDD
jgi:DNA-directed RNA polymerase specialized sigma24 family protein